MEDQHTSKDSSSILLSIATANLSIATANLSIATANLSIATANRLWLYFKNFVSHRNTVWLVFVVGGSSFHFSLKIFFAAK